MDPPACVLGEVRRVLSLSPIQVLVAPRIAALVFGRLGMLDGNSLVSRHRG